MSRKIKVIGLVLVAVLAMSAVAASGAQAAVGKLTAEKYPAWITGEQESTGLNKLNIGGGVRNVECSTTKYDATIKEATESITVTPTYSGCTSTGGTIATITTNACTYTLSVPDVAITSGGLVNTITNCPSTAPLKIVIEETGPVVLCEYTIENQTAIGNSSWANVASSPKTVTLTLNATGVVLKVIKGSKIVCGAAAGNTVTGSLTGTVLVKGFQDESGLEGAQQGIDIG